MPFISNAENFLEYPGVLENNDNIGVMKETIAYLLGNAQGLENAVATDIIIEHLKDLGYDYSKEWWQQHVLGPLRENKIYIASHKSKGMYLITSETEAQSAHNQLVKRLTTENRRRLILEELMDEAGYTRTERFEDPV